MKLVYKEVRKTLVLFVVAVYTGLVVYKAIKTGEIAQEFAGMALGGFGFWFGRSTALDKPGTTESNDIAKEG